MKLGSLKVRMIVGTAVSIAFALVLAGIALRYMFVESVERGARSDLSATMARLVALVDLDVTGAVPRLSGRLPDPRYDTPQSGLYWQVRDMDSQRTTRSRSLWDRMLDADSKLEGQRFSTMTGPAGQSLIALSLNANFKTNQQDKRYQIIVAQDRSILDDSIKDFAWSMVTALLVLGGALVIVAVLQVHFGLLPFKKLRRDVESIRKGTASSVESSYPAEVVPLVVEVNELLALQQKSIEFARSRAADLAHGLKTPLSVIGAIAHELEVRGDHHHAAAIADLANEMHERIDYQLRLSRLRHRARLHMLRAPLNPVVTRAMLVLQKTKEGERLEWLSDMKDEFDVDIDANDLIELVGVVLENAAKWAKSTVGIQVRKDGDAAELRISDDGPGIDQPNVNLVGVRGRRFDESAPGSGLGLAIAREIVALNNGSMSFQNPSGGGTLVVLRLPLAPARNGTEGEGPSRLVVSAS
ncbi:MAG TPA: HAMP domain-containing sensor histidine kinase [Mesorhizobium sp.]|jgi:signal transduction histidine kinase|uniref:sensor histidine kinase n=1 Tax=Mesorhizobium sp. TaxID=1871066 RepID=UPI002DDCEE37|nr:HAMP domain-containing sensor histidine kinase [Mesorhizobium sp.]HEV2506685.1 HAMP domain-containing sensor histidine kinase [Mesorhizobium sp.]